MGCDIHTFIDFDDFETKDGDWYVSSFANDLSFGRNYTLFTLMAGVRYDERVDLHKPLFEPRGIFERLSWRTKERLTLRVDDDGAKKEWEGYCTKKDAQSWLKSGYSKAYGDNKVTGPDWHSISWLLVSELKDVISAYEKIKFYESSWFQMKPPEKQPIPDNATATPLKRRYNNYGDDTEWYVTVGEAKTYPAPVYLRALVAAMDVLNGDNPERSRLIFWFDN